MSSEIKEMLDAQDEFRALFESAPDLMYTHDLRGIISRVNRAFERVTGYSREEATGSNFFDFVAPRDREAAREHVFAQLGGEAAAPFSIALLTKDGLTIQVEVLTELTF